MLARQMYKNIERFDEELDEICRNHATKIHKLEEKVPSVREIARMNKKTHFIKMDALVIAYRIMSDKKQFEVNCVFFKEFKTKGGRVYGFWMGDIFFFYTAHFFDRLIQRNVDQAENRYQAKQNNIGGMGVD